MLEGRRWMSYLHREKICPSSLFLSYSGPQWVGRCPPTLGGRFFLRLLIHLFFFSSNLQVIWASLSPERLTQ